MTEEPFVIGPFLANLAYPLGSVLAVVCLVAFAVAVVVVRSTVSAKAERDRRARLVILSILGGPLAGLALAGFAHALGVIYPADIDYTYVKFASTGGIAGFITGLIFALTSLLSSNES